MRFASKSFSPGAGGSRGAWVSWAAHEWRLQSGNEAYRGCSMIRRSCVMLQRLPECLSRVLCCRPRAATYGSGRGAASGARARRVHTQECSGEAPGDLHSAFMGRVLLSSSLLAVYLTLHALPQWATHAGSAGRACG
jgi:hypothetical protein